MNAVIRQVMYANVAIGATNLSAEERHYYAEIFRSADPQRSGFIQGKAAVTLFLQSGLSRDILSNVNFIECLELLQLCDALSRAFL